MEKPSLQTELPDPLPEDPLPLVETWTWDALKQIENATAAALATVETDGRPAARMVICRGVDAQTGAFTFYTDRSSPKAQALRARPQAALLFHWQPFLRQIRIEGPVDLAPDYDSDAYWAMRPREARVAGTTSNQSRPVASRAELMQRFETNLQRLGDVIPRPADWGGYRVWAERVELWVGQPGRLHDRALWTRELQPAEDGFKGGPWSATRLEP